MDRFLSSARVLIVEDQVLIAIMLEELLRGLGCVSTEMAHNKPQALSAVKSYAPTLALLDLSLGQNGPDFDLADHLDDERIGFVFASGHAPSIVPQRHRSRPFVQKPFTDAKLSVAIRAIMAGE